MLKSLTARDKNPNSRLPCYAFGINHRLGISDASFNLAKYNVKDLNTRKPLF